RRGREQTRVSSGTGNTHSEKGIPTEHVWLITVTPLGPCRSSASSGRGPVPTASRCWASEPSLQEPRRGIRYRSGPPASPPRRLRGWSFTGSRRFAKLSSLFVPFVGLHFDLLHGVLEAGPFFRSHRHKLKA